MINLALALAKSGIKVYIPQLPKLTELEISNHTINLISHFYSLIVKENYKKNIVPAGISFGGGLLIKALTKTMVKNFLPKSILTYGTYFSLASSIEFLLSGRIISNGNEEFIKPNDWGLIVLFHNFLSGIDAGFDTSQMEKVLRLRVKNKIVESNNELRRLPEDQKKIMFDILNSKQTKIIKKLTEKMKTVYQEELEDISPSNVCNEINYKVFLMHGANDSMVPYTESIKLSKKIKKSQLFLSGLYEHREISKSNSLIKKICELKHMSNFFTDFMDYNES